MQLVTIYVDVFVIHFHGNHMNITDTYNSNTKWQQWMVMKHMF